MLDAGSRDGEEKLERSLRLARQAGLDGDVGRAFNNLVAGALVSRAYGLAERYVEDGIEYCEDRGLDLWRQLLLANRVKLELDRGRWGEAADSAGRLLRDPSCALGARLEALVAIAAGARTPRRPRGLGATGRGAGAVATNGGVTGDRADGRGARRGRVA